MGLPAGSREANKQLGLVFGTRSQLYMHMTVYESLDLISEIYFVTGAEKEKAHRTSCGSFSNSSSLAVARTDSLFGGENAL